MWILQTLFIIGVYKKFAPHRVNILYAICFNQVSAQFAYNKTIKNASSLDLINFV